MSMTNMTEWHKNNQLQALSWKPDNCLWDIKSQLLCFRPEILHENISTTTPHLHTTPYMSALLWHISAGHIRLKYLGCNLCLTFSPLGTDRKGGHSRMKFFDHVVDSDMKLSAPLYLMKALTMCHLSFSPHIPLPYGSCSPVSLAGRGSRGSWWSCRALCIAVRPAALSDRPPWCLEQR